MKTICITSSKGGAGKTTATCELAAALKVLGKKVLVIDMDQRRGATKHMGLNLTEEQRRENGISTIYDVLVGEGSIDMAILPLDSFDMIVGDKRMEKPERTFNDPDDPYLLEKFKEAMDECGLKYDYMFIDHGPQNDITTEMSYISSDDIYISTFRDMENLDDAEEVTKEIIKKRHQRNNQVKGELKGFILGRYEKGAVADVAEARLKNEIIPLYMEESDKEIPIYKIRKAADFEKAQIFTQPVTYSKKSSAAARDVYEIAEHIINTSK